MLWPDGVESGDACVVVGFGGVQSRDLGQMNGDTRLRIGSVPYLNAVPLTWGLEAEACFEPPSRLVSRLHRGELDAALVSITEVLLNPGYSVLDGVGIVSRGPVYSVVLAHRRPLEELQSIELDPASCTSVQLLKVL